MVYIRVIQKRKQIDEQIINERKLNKKKFGKSRKENRNKKQNKFHKSIF